MHDAARVRAPQRAADLLANRSRLHRRQWAAQQALGEALAVHQLGDVVGPLLGVAEVEDLHDAGIAHPRQELRLALEPVDPRAVLRPPRLDHLHRHRASKAPVEASVDAPEGTLADRGVQLVAIVESAAGEIGRAQHGYEYSAPGPARGAYMSLP